MNNTILISQKVFLPFIFSIYCFMDVYAQTPKKYHLGEIQQRIQKLSVLGSVLYIAAHPDDENTRLISYYANEKLLRTAYLSATRGDGGQNLIGSELGEKLGIIRTQELLSARAIDGGQQFFSRANDFGYSKNPDETFNIWDKNKVLGDFVWIIRNFRPDVIITRFSLNLGVTHGHHTASAILAKEAFEISKDASKYPEQLKYVDVWQPKKIFWNTSPWFFRRSGKVMDTSKYVKINVGKYNQNLGLSYTEIAALSRSMHKSQGFGSTGKRGDLTEYLEPWSDQKPIAPFQDMDVSWNRCKGSEKIKEQVANIQQKFNSSDPLQSISDLLLLRKLLLELENDFWKKIKLQEVDELIRAITGLYLELVSNTDTYVPGDSIQLSLETVNRSNITMSLDAIYLEALDQKIVLNEMLEENQKIKKDYVFELDKDLPLSQPYWLKESSSLGMYTVKDQTKIGQPENLASLKVSFFINIDDQRIKYTQPIVYKKNDPVNGEVYEPVHIVPKVMVNCLIDVMIFSDNSLKKIPITVIAGQDNIKGDLKLSLPKGWSSQPANAWVDIKNKGEERVYNFEISPPKEPMNEEMEPYVEIENKKYVNGKTVIDYNHIPKQTLLPKTKTKLIKLDLIKKGENIGYIEGAGDNIAENLAQIGYNVDLLEKGDIVLPNIKKYDAIVLGIRAFNTVDWLAYKNKILFEYVKQGGNLIVQYNTNHRLVTEEIAPYALSLSRDRVTSENAPVTLLTENHPVLNTPNKITRKDFDGWIQERGLYFPNQWAKEFIPILACNDPKETPKKGGLLIAKYGKGNYVYTGYSWFRNLPVGVSGAYRLFVNLISLDK